MVKYSIINSCYIGLLGGLLGFYMGNLYDNSKIPHNEKGIEAILEDGNGDGKKENIIYIKGERYLIEAGEKPTLRLLLKH